MCLAAIVKGTDEVPCSEYNGCGVKAREAHVVDAVAMGPEKED